MLSSAMSDQNLLSSAMSDQNSMPVVAVNPANELRSPEDRPILNLQEIPIRALNVSCRSKLSLLLNPEALTDKDGYNRDYRGIAELLGFEHDHILAFMRENDPMGKILSNWQNEAGSTVGVLLSHLEFLDRSDVIDQIKPIAERNAQEYLTRQQNDQITQVQVSQVDYEAIREQQTPDDIEHLTLADATGYGPEHFDAYVCYADEDFEFVKYMSNELESRGIKVCIKDRDVLPSRFEYDSIVRIIEERCSRMLIIWSPEFSKSAQCDFLTKFATGLTVEYQRHKIIPVIYKQYPLSRGIKFLSKVDFTRPNVMCWSWDRLIISLKQGNASYIASHFATNNTRQPLSPPPYQSQENPLPINYQNGSNQQTSTQSFDCIGDNNCSTPEPIVNSPPPSLCSTETSSSAITYDSETLDLPSPPSTSISQSSSTSSVKKPSSKIHKVVKRIVNKLTPAGHSDKKQHSS